MSKAIIEETKKLKTKFPKLAYKALGKTQFHVSEAGLGMYRMSHQNQNHRDAFKQALNNGINVIDTSSNYMDGDSETLVGNELSNCSVNRESIDYYKSRLYSRV